MQNSLKFLKCFLRSLQTIFFKFFELCTKYFLAYKVPLKSESSKFLEIPISKGSIPIIGTLYDLIVAGGAPKLHKYIHKRHEAYGSIFRERLGGTQDAVFLASANLMRSVFLHEGQHPRHPLPDAWTLYNETHKCQRGLFFMEGTEWFHNRRLLNRLLLNGNLDWMDAHINACTELLLDEFKSAILEKPTECYEIENLEQQLYRWSINVICAIMFGATAILQPHVELAIDEFTQIVHKIFENTSQLMTFPPRLAKFLKLKIWREFEENVADVLSQGSLIIERFMNLLAQDADKSSYTEETHTLFQKLQASAMPLDMIKRIFVDLVIAAGDTTAFSSQWALYILARNVALQQKISFDVFKNGANATLVHGLIKETLRLYPIAPFIGRYLANDAILEGYHLKKDTLVLLSLYTAGRDAAHFPDPLAVKPERWQRNSQTSQLSGVQEAHGTLPFAIGIRSCIGRRIALKQLESLVAAFTTNLDLKCNNETPVESVLRLVTVPNQKLRLAIKLRDNH